jgi:hypothetical protein
MVCRKGVGLGGTDPFVVVVNGYSEGAFGPILADDMAIQFRTDLTGFREGL